MSDTPTDSTSKKEKRQRKPGRPKSESSYTKWLHLRLTEAQVQRLHELAKEANCHRTDVLRAALGDGQLAVVRGTGQAKGYREVVKLDAGLRELQRLPSLPAAAQASVKALLTQVEVVLTALQEPAL